MKEIRMDWATFQAELEDSERKGAREGHADMARQMILCWHIISNSTEFNNCKDMLGRDAENYFPYKEMVKFLNEIKGFKKEEK